MKGLQFQGELENPGGIFGVFLKKMVLALSKEKGKPTVKSHIHFNRRWLEDVVSLITTLKLWLRWLLRGPVPLRMQPGETFPSSKACSSLFMQKNFLCLALSEEKVDFSLCSSTKSPIRWSDERSYQCLWCPQAKPSSPAHAMAPQGKVMETALLLKLLWWESSCYWVN